VERHEGIVNQFVGDEVLALFGIPVAHEDDPVRAVRAAFEIHELVREISPEVQRRIGTKLRMHTGISTGLVVTHIRDIREGSYGITGDTVNMGARLATVAEMNDIIVGPETYNLTAPFFKTIALEPLIVKGKAKPLTPYRVIEESAVRTRFEAARIHGFSDFTGREHELTILYSCLEKALTGKGQFVTVAGEAGLGKSRLAYEFRHSLNRSAIKHIISLIPSHPLMVLVVYRPEYSANWGNWSHHTPIILNALDHLNCENVIKSVWDIDQVPKKISTLIHELTGGNPFFVEEISSELIEGGTVQISDRQAVLKQSLNNLSLPNTVQAVIRTRLDRLDRWARESLRLASVIGREFARKTLEHISDSTERLSESLEILKKLELIQQIQVVPEAEYLFKHVITQEVTYETLLKQKRKELHSLVGQAMEELYADRLEEFYEMLAFHYRRAEDWSRAYRYNREAGLKAQSFSAYQEALSYLKAAFEALNKLPRTRTHLEQEIDLRFNMRSALFPLGKHDDWADHIRKAELRAREIGDNARLANCHNYLISYHFIRGRHKEAIRVGEEGLRLAESVGDFSVKITTKYHLGIALYSTGQIERAVELHRKVANQLSGQAAFERHGLSGVPSVLTRSFLAWGLSEIGEFKEAQMYSRQGIELAEHVKNVFSTALVYAQTSDPNNYNQYLARAPMEEVLVLPVIPKSSVLKSL
jgi:tetratricopeptide (TPR) repeat protein